MKRLQNKVIIVTGAAQGLGAACARRYASEGAKVVIADIAAEKARGVADSIVKSGSEAIAVAVDVSSEEAVIAMVATAVGQFGRLDVLHNNAAFLNRDFLVKDTAVADLDIDVFDKTIAVNLRGYLLAAKHAIPRILEGGGGSIINTSSRSGTDGELSLTSYGVSKAGVNLLTKDIATQYGKQGIRCNALLIAAMLTEHSQANHDPALRERTERQLLVEHMATPEQIADAALFLASDESSFVQGHLLVLDGGWGAHNPRYADSMDALNLWPTAKRQ